MRSVSAEGSGAFHHDQDGTLVLSLQNCIELALQRNPLVVATGRAIEASEAQLMEAKAVPWPVLEYRYRTAPVPTDVDNALKTFFEGQVTFFNSLYLAVGIPVTTFGQLRTAQSMAKGGVEAARLNKTKEQESTIAQIKKMYYGLQLAADMKDLLKTTIGELNKRVDQEEKKDIPDESPLALLRLKALALELETRQAEVEQNEALAMQGMRIQLDLPEDVRFR
ncbi:MAG: TolC family protein, partial [Deltaproteobacteria bacterium]|nr:TolC family protein [Deltaproteobacteria bacterium]